ncbi:hypothetical protein [Flavisolibacter ginsengisoli]|nr:hypothetical protein [Flavisolibacter ginsengisoli]
MKKVVRWCYLLSIILNNKISNNPGAHGHEQLQMSSITQPGWLAN